MKAYENFGYILEDEVAIVNEYARLLKRYGLTTIIVLTKIDTYGVKEARLYADEDEYLELATKNINFITEEKQTKMFLDYIKMFFDVMDILDEFVQNDDDYDMNDEEK